MSDHTRTIVHIDIDCFYAQVEMVKNPSLHNVPLGIQQKNIVVTSNYIAREYGIKKCMLVKDALNICPNLQLVNGEDLHDYRQISYKITNHLHKYSEKVERLGLDENYVDVSDLVGKRLPNTEILTPAGHIYGFSETCECGCKERLTLASHIAEEMRKSILENFTLTTCAGIAHNKLLAKICGTKNKPNQQTVVFPVSAAELLLGLKSPTDIPGIGKVTGDLLFNKLGIGSIVDLQNCGFSKLSSVLGADRAQYIYDLSFGIDHTPVKSSGKPNSIGLEDSCKPMSVESEIHQKFQQLLSRLMILVKEDGRIPRSIKLSVRKHDDALKISLKETKQCKISPMLFKNAGKIDLSRDAEAKVMKIIMTLFTKIVDIKKTFHVTLLGLSFTKFQDLLPKTSITKFFSKNIEVQSLTNIENKTNDEIFMDYVMNIPGDVNNAESETECEPSPKKTKFTLNLDKRMLKYSSSEDLFSPSKLKVAELQLNSKDSDCIPVSSKVLFPDQNVPCPPDMDKSVFKELPVDVQKELWKKHVRKFTAKDQTCTSAHKPKVNSIVNYIVKH